MHLFTTFRKLVNHPLQTHNELWKTKQISFSAFNNSEDFSFMGNFTKKYSIHDFYSAFYTFHRENVSIFCYE